MLLGELGRGAETERGSWLCLGLAEAIASCGEVVAGLCFCPFIPFGQPSSLFLYWKRKGLSGGGSVAFHRVVG